MIRSFLGWFVRIGTEPRIDVYREVQEREDALVEAREGGEMTAPMPTFPDNRQRQPLKNLQQAFSRRESGRPLWVADVQPCQCRLGCRQALAAPELHHDQDPTIILETLQNLGAP
jgi:hypothetical protein